jgi:hypothetical protein
MTALLDFPITTSDPFAVHTADVGHYDTRPAAARVPFQISVQLPAHYLAAALYLDLGIWGADELDSPETVREVVATCLMNSKFAEIEDTAIELAARAGQLDQDESQTLEFCRRKIAEAFAPCDPWAVTGMPCLASTPPAATVHYEYGPGRPVAPSDRPRPATVVPYACDPS